MWKVLWLAVDVSYVSAAALLFLALRGWIKVFRAEASFWRRLLGGLSLLALSWSWFAFVHLITRGMGVEYPLPPMWTGTSLWFMILGMALAPALKGPTRRCAVIAGVLMLFIWGMSYLDIGWVGSLPSGNPCWLIC